MLTSVICSSTCVPQLASTSRISNCFLDRTNPTGLFVSRLTKTTMYCPWLSRRFHLCLVVSIDTNLFWFFFYWCVLPLTKLLHLSVHYSEQRCGHCYSLLAWLFLILVGWYIYIFYLQNLSPHKGFGASFTFKLSTVDFQSNLTVTDRQVFNNHDLM